MKFYRSKFYRTFPVISILTCLIVLISGCRTKADENQENVRQDTLKVVTLYGPTSYFIYRGEPLGIDYENVRKFAEDEGYILDIRTAKNIRELIDLVKSGEADLGAYPVPIIGEYKEEIRYCGPIERSTQVLVQKNGKEKLKDVTELVGKDVYVEKDSKFHYRLVNLNEELGGGINIMILDNDTITNEDILRKVNSGEIDYAVVDSQTSNLYGDAFPNLDLSLNLSSEQASSWAVGLQADSLASKINNWENRSHFSESVKEIYKRFYDKSVNDDFDFNLTYFKGRNLKNNGTVSPYDNLFKKHASTASTDWKILAAIGFCESRYTPDVVSPFGATGLMQVMPATAEAMGVSAGELRSPDSNVYAAAKILSRLNKNFADKVADPEERLKFVVAAYNSGLGHIYDAMALAEKQGLDPAKWTGNVGVAALMKSRPEYYNDPVVKHGYFRGRETVDFVDHVFSIYRYLNDNI